MHRESWMTDGRWLAGLAVLAFWAGSVRADGPPHGPPKVTVGPVGVEVGVEADVQSPKPSEYWIGLMCGTVPEMLRAHLKLPKDQGLLVMHVVPESPAAEAGIKQHDVLVKAGGEPLKELVDLVTAVRESKDKKLSLEVQRGGKSTKVDVTPSKRPKDMPLPSDHKVFPGWIGSELAGPPKNAAPEIRKRIAEQQEAIKQWIEKVRPGVDGQPDVRFRFLHPGTILPPDGKSPPLPGNMTVTIIRHGEEPAKIKVTRNGDHWEVTEDELDKLPDDIRPHIGRMIIGVGPGSGAKSQAFDFNFVPDLQHLKEWRQEAAEKIRSAAPVEKQMEQMKRQMDETRKSVEEMRKLIEELRKSRPRLRDTDDEPKKI